jgi:hypothetical protein
MQGKETLSISALANVLLFGDPSVRPACNSSSSNNNNNSSSK